MNTDPELVERWTKFSGDCVEPLLSSARRALMRYIVMRTFPLLPRPDDDAIRVAQITEGTRNGDGEYHDHGTGYGRSTNLTALRGLETLGLVLREGAIVTLDLERTVSWAVAEWERRGKPINPEDWHVDPDGLRDFRKRARGALRILRAGALREF